MAQSTQTPSDTGTGKMQGTQPGQQSEQSMGHTGDQSGAQSAPQGTLMQKREQGMSPQGGQSGEGGTSPDSATGKMQQ
jgi:hypothetical protein